MASPSASTVSDLADSSQKLRGTQLETRELDRVVGDLVRDVENAQVVIAGIMPSARIIDPATTPRLPLKPNATFGLLAGLVLGVLAAAVWAWFDLQRTPYAGATSRGAEEQVQGWRREGVLPFPHFPDPLVREKQNTLDWPPSGSPGAAGIGGGAR